MANSIDTELKNILLVDDEDSLVTFLKKLLEREGYNVVTAGNGKQAVDVYKAYMNCIDLVLMDISMPVMDGIEAHRSLTRFDPNLSILLMSGYAQESLTGIENIHFIRKPIHPVELFKSI